MTELEKKSEKEVPDLYKRSVKGGFWVFALRLVTQGLGFVKSIIVVNCLILENLGLIAIAVMLMEILNTFSESGFNAALVQKKEEDISDYLDTAWVIGIIRGIALFTILYFTAPLFASFKVSDENISLAINIMRAMGVCMLLSGFRNIGTVYFQKNMEFHKTFWMQLAGTLTDIVVSITLVIIYRSVWGYVIARLVSACVGLALSYLLCPYRPKFHFVPEKAKELWTFGKWIFSNNIWGFILSQGDDFFVWFYLGVPQLALYRYAYRFAVTPASHISLVINQVSFPAYSKVQNDLPRLREAYIKVLNITALFSVPTAFFILFLGPDFVHLFLPERMWPMTIALQVLAFKGLLGSLTATYGPVFRAVGKPWVISYITLLCLIILALTIYPFTKAWGFVGTAFATLLCGVLLNPLYFFLIHRILQCPIGRMLKQIAIPLAASIISTVLLATCRNLLFQKTTFISFAALVIIGIVVYFAVVAAFDHVYNHGIKQLLKEQIGTFIKK